MMTVFECSVGKAYDPVSANSLYQPMAGEGFGASRMDIQQMAPVYRSSRGYGSPLMRRGGFVEPSRARHEPHLFRGPASVVRPGRFLGGVGRVVFR
jgi:hypothetical protein